MNDREHSATTRPSPVVGLFLVAVLSFPACRSDEESPGGTDQTPDRGGATLFTEITTDVGLPGVGDPWPDGTFFMPEVMGPGVGLLDYDGDGDLDILRIRVPLPGRHEPAPNRLYQQQPDGSFRDVTEGSGLNDPGYGQGVAVGDTDNDGDLDVYFVNFGPDAFYVNNGDGTFREATADAGIADDDWGSSATFCDYDGDGDLDLYVANYLRYEHRGACLDADSREIYCGPIYFDGVPDKLYRNDGGDRFTDVTAAAGITLPDGAKDAKGLGVVCTDLTRDGRPDIFVANDGELNQLWVNRGDGTFSEEGIMRGVAVNRDGVAEASMGVAVGDIDRDGFLDLYMTHLAQENNRLYAGGPAAMLTDRSVESRLSRHDLAMTGFGCGFFDYDNDGDLDLAVVNGRVYGERPVPGAGLGEFWNRYAEPNFLFENDGTGVFNDVSSRAGVFTQMIGVSRGLAFGDLDNDGDVDFVSSDYDTSLRVFRNDAAPPGNHWLIVRALTGARDAVGAQLTVFAGAERLTALILPGYSYQSSNDPRAHIGLGGIERLDGIEIAWPDGRSERFEVSQVDREVTLVQGTGETS